MEDVMIERYDIWYYYDERQEDVDDNGEWVKYIDHLAAMQAKDAVIRECHMQALADAGQFFEERDQLRAENERLREALKKAEAALSDIGDADREDGDDLAWCEARAAEVIPAVRAALQRKTGE